MANKLFYYIKEQRDILLKILFIFFMLLCLMPQISAPMALFLGITFSMILSNPFLSHTHYLIQRLLQFSVIGLGAGMNLAVVGHESIHGIVYTVIGIISTLLLGLAVGKCLKTEANTSLLLTVGTAICGGSAIAAVAPVIRAKPHEISVAIAIVFFLNASALFIFPPIGHYFDLTQIQFGFWSALAIHDTSSVIGAAIEYGSKSVDIATTVKMARALWIIPVALIISFIWHKRGDNESAGKAKFPLFILGFILVAALVTYLPALQATGLFVSAIAKRTLVLTLFLIGSTLVRSTFINVGIMPFVQGIVLWFIMASVTLIAILFGLIH
jgi:uncharacterized integral membrane protein (TIGR00698 family)